MTDRYRVVPASYVLLLRGDGERTEVLLQLRANTGFMDGHWAAAAAGHVEEGEDAPAAAVREAREELGVTIDPADLLPLTAVHRTQRNGDPVDERVDFFFTARRWTGEPHAAETGKTAGLDWFPLAALPVDTVPHERAVLDAVRRGGPAAITSHGFR
ncbi:MULTISPECIES: NUDIX domain-containing protein [unclassified Pseudonocardia]|uniref:NUDIX hydrolase n=1 Tax=unclassified Pseudonocardia TaxID=2619320 RepID=UPI0001FFE34F|nr:MULTISPECIES: NUDIX domain-containing protein [unclassified Pseudonocardia]ALE74402.1 DNA mismatch repair protein MutT [Pseudonocardia sp. EC080625-04]ALL77814.1 DNA mismatch repair protein MutT [Pseudonocardia sp. EC080610-09]ALL80730.1 DNA mismatch repair protein MutT [Pseudonocardia sp. EC080619-01]OLM17325.1 putative MutT-family protein [Pseudonocardia sp. Ae707_Ps1]